MVMVAAGNPRAMPHHPEVPVAPPKHSHLRPVAESRVDVVAIGTQFEIGGDGFFERLDDRVVLAQKDPGHLVFTREGSGAQVACVEGVIDGDEPTVAFR